MSTTIKQDFLNLENKEFFIDYFDLLISRITNFNMSIEKDIGNSQNNIIIMDNMKAFKILIKTMFQNGQMTEDLIKKTASTVNEHSLYISNDYRKVGEFSDELKFPISRPENIRNDLLNLIYKYDNEWNTLDVFEREASFHISFIKIQPFEDGNRRTARLLLNFNLLRQGRAPVVVTNDLLEYYYQYLRDDDIQGMTRLFQIQAMKEQEIINQLFEQFKKDSSRKK